MSEDWVAVAEAIIGRMRELKLSQRDLAVHSNVSVATIREIQRHRINRRRNPRTLESLSESLGWPRQYLDAVLDGRRPQDPAEAAGDDTDLKARLEQLEQRLDMIVDVVHRIDAKIDIIIDPRHGDPKHGDPNHGDPKHGAPEPGDPRQRDPQHGREAAGTPAGIPAARSRPSGPGS